MNNPDVAADDADLTLGVYHGWWIVAGLFFVLTISSGFGFYNLSVYLNVLADTRGFAVADVSIAVGLFFFVGGVTGMWVASLIRRIDVRWVMTGGAAIAGSALGLIGHVTELWQLYLVYALFGAGNSGVSIVVATTLVTRWFPGPNRSVALSIASTGLSMGGVLLTPLSAWSRAPGGECTGSTTRVSWARRVRCTRCRLARVGQAASRSFGSGVVRHPSA